MPYSKFTLSKAVEDFQLTIVEGDRFLPEISPVNPSSLLGGFSGSKERRPQTRTGTMFSGDGSFPTL
ncbi:hypothetical protein [Tolypothrix tenuis]|uniref:hypothetical protein n=1 Tax=Tolypothrix tenuis TaxID=457083 RepID=UPI003BB5465B